MNKKQAYDTLNLSDSASPEEIKKKYKELAKKLHPDVNKEDGAESKFKKINEAYQVLTSPEEESHQGFNPFSQGFNPFAHQGFNPFENSQPRRQAHDIRLNSTISFKESVLGSSKDLNFNRKIKCQDCNGNGSIPLDNGCAKCKGKGQVISKQGNMIFSQTCDSCFGKTKSKKCDKCDMGCISTDTSISVNIPGGVVSNNILRLAGIGNFAGGFMGGDQYTDVLLHITVTPEEGLSLQDSDVISMLQITLIDAVNGCEKEINTVLGLKSIKVDKMSRNKDEIIINNAGVNKVGNHRVILDVKYPDNIQEMLKQTTK